MITTAKELRKLIGSMVYWEDRGSRYDVQRCGIVEDVSGKNVLIDGDWKWRPDLRMLSTTPTIKEA
jgi:hypothetical protein